MRSFWRKVQVLRGARAGPSRGEEPLRDEHGRLVIGAEKERVLRHYNVELAKAAPAEEYDVEFGEQLQRELDECIGLSDHYAHEALEALFSEEELVKALKEGKNGKAAGPDGIPMELLKHGGRSDTFRKSLLTLVNFFYEKEAWPTEWQLGIITPVHKTGPKDDPGNYRNITLLSCLSKLMDSMLNSRLYLWAEANNRISEEQGGFRQHRRTQDQIFLLHEIATSRWERRKSTYLAFLDITKAYDRVWREGLWVAVWRMGIQGRPWRMLRKIYGKVRREVVSGAGRSAAFEVEAGVAQGAISSPFLFTCFIDGLLRSLRRAGFGVMLSSDLRIGCLAYADDLVLIAESASELQRGLDMVTEYARQWRFDFSPKKSNVVVHGSEADKRVAHEYTFRLASVPLRVVDEYKYLGVEFGKTRCRWKSVIGRLLGKAGKLTGMLTYVGCHSRGFQSSTSIYMWNTLIRPVCEYACDVWEANQTQLDALSISGFKFLRGVFGCSTRVPNDVLLSEAGQKSFAARQDGLALRFWHHVSLCLAKDGCWVGMVTAMRLSQVRQLLELRQVQPRTRQAHGSKSLLLRYHGVLLRYGMAEYWQDPKLAGAMPYSTWCGIVDGKVRDKELEQRAERLLARASTERYARLLMHTELRPAAYLRELSQRGRLGQWLLLHLRAGALPLLVRAGKWASPEWSSAARVCMMCGAGEEDEMHFVCHCAALQPQRSQLQHELRVRLLDAGHDLTHPTASQVLQAAGSEDDSMYALVLGGVDAVQALHMTAEERDRRRRRRDRRQRGGGGVGGAGSGGEAAGDEDDDADEAIRDAMSGVVWSTCSNYLCAIWKYRCERLSGVILPDKQGAMCVESVTKAFRCRTL